MAVKGLTVDEETLEVHENPLTTHILVSQDEKIHHSNDQLQCYWSDGSFTQLPPKSMGQTVMTSDFISETYGFIRHSDKDPVVPGKGLAPLLM